VVLSTAVFTFCVKFFGIGLNVYCVPLYVQMLFYMFYCFNDILFVFNAQRVLVH